MWYVCALSDKHSIFKLEACRTQLEQHTTTDIVKAIYHKKLPNKPIIDAAARVLILYIIMLVLSTVSVCCIPDPLGDSEVQ